MTKLNYMKIFTFPVLLMISVLSFASYMAWNEYTMNNLLVEQSLSGNSVAIQILSKYKKPWKLDKRIIHAALEGNDHAIRILDLKHAEDD